MLYVVRNRCAADSSKLYPESGIFSWGKESQWFYEVQNKRSVRQRSFLLAEAAENVQKVFIAYLEVL